MHNFIEVNGEEVHVYPHAGQLRVLESDRRIILAVAGSQSGKSSIGPLWVKQELERCGPGGDHLVIAPTYKLLGASALPKFIAYMQDILRLGTFFGSPFPRFVVSEDGSRRLWGHATSDKTLVRFSYATKSDAVEALSLKSCWADECGMQDFPAATWQNLWTRRLAVHEGRALLTSTPYSCTGWYRDLCDEAERGAEHIDLIRFISTANPNFSKEALAEAKRTLPDWKFRMMFKGSFERPAGQIFGSFKPKLAPQGHLIKRFDIPESWTRYCGLDFGSVNFASVHLAKGEGEYEGKYIAYRGIHGGGARVAADRAPELLKGEPRVPVAYGGSGSEDQFRAELTGAGFRVNKPPIHEVEPMIDRVYAAFATDQILIFDDLKPLISELMNYSRKTDENGLVLDEIANKSTFHFVDALRYIVSHLRHQDVKNRISRPFAGTTGFS